MSTAETLALVRQVLSKVGANGGELNKVFGFAQPGTATTGLQNYDLEMAVRSFVPTFSPLRNRIPRTSGKGGLQANWKAITQIDQNQQYAGVEEGKRGGQITQAMADYYAAYRTLGRENSVSFEAQLSAEGFDDLRARAVMNLLQKTMEEEEKIILGGNSIHQLGTTPTPSCAATTTGGTIPLSTTVSVICVALTYDAFRRLNGATAIVQQTTRANMDGTTTTVNGGTATPSASGTVATGSGTSTNTVTAKVAPVRGAYGYAWYAGTVGAEKFVSVTAVSQVVVTSLPGSGQTAASLTAADYSTDTLIHDGLLGFIGNPALNSYYNAVAAGATLTPDGAGGINEFDVALQSFWDNYRLSPSRILIASQEAISIKKLVTQAGAATSLARFNFQMTQNGMVGGALPKGYNNPFGTQQEIPIEQHPFMVPGTILFLTDDLPYPMNNVSNIMEIQCRQDYWQNEWPVVSRSYSFGVYSDQVLKHYFPPSMGVITNLTKV